MQTPTVAGPVLFWRMTAPRPAEGSHGSDGRNRKLPSGAPPLPICQ